MSDQNMQIWNRVEKTDIRFTKKAKVNGQDITSLSGTAMAMKATELFGPVGIGWGWRIIEERFDEATRSTSVRATSAPVSAGKSVTRSRLPSGSPRTASAARSSSTAAPATSTRRASA